MTSDLSSVAREAAERAVDEGEVSAFGVTKDIAYVRGFTECASRIPSRGEIAGVFALRAYPHGVLGERLESAAAAARHELRPVFLAQADAVLALIGERLTQ